MNRKHDIPAGRIRINLVGEFFRLSKAAVFCIMIDGHCIDDV